MKSPIAVDGFTVTRRKEGVSVAKADGTLVEYFMFPEFEIHYNEVAPGTVQQWHHHERIEESLYIVSGQLEAHWTEDGVEESAVVEKGDIVRVGTVPHTFVNNTADVVTFIVFKMVPDGVDKHEIIKTDKQVDSPPPGWAHTARHEDS